MGKGGSGFFEHGRADGKFDPQAAGSSIAAARTNASSAPLTVAATDPVTWVIGEHATDEGEAAAVGEMVSSLTDEFDLAQELVVKAALEVFASELGESLERGDAGRADDCVDGPNVRRGGS